MNCQIALRLIACCLMVLPSASLAAGHPCAGEADAQARLACYDRAFPPIAEAQSQPVARSEAELRQQFGLSGRELEQRKPEAERTPQIDSIEADVTSVRAIQGGRRVLGLDNGQTWQITEGGTRGHLKVGDRVVIRRAMMGSHILSTPGGVGLRVRRLN